MEKTNELLENIKTTKIYLNKSKETSGDKFQIKMTYKNKTIYFVFNDNYLNESGKKDFLNALYLDALSYEEAQDLCEFMRSFGYEEEKEANKIYNACKKQHKKFNKLFDLQEQQQIAKILENY